MSRQDGNFELTEDEHRFITKGYLYWRSKAVEVPEWEGSFPPQERLPKARRDAFNRPFADFFKEAAAE